jgi:hypothetical protein
MVRSPFAVSLLSAVLVAAAGIAAAAAPSSPAELFDAAVALVQGADADLRGVGLERLRFGLKGEQFTRRISGEVLPAARPDVQVALLSVLADRGDKGAIPGVTALATSSTDAAVRAAAAGIPAVGKRAARCFPEPLIPSNERQNSWAICS